MTGTALSVGVLAGVSALGIALAGLGGAASYAQAASGAADTAALAAADVLSGALPGEPCATAARIARRNGFLLDACDVSGADVTVTVTGAFAGIPVIARARAGAPRGGTDG